MQINNKLIKNVYSTNEIETNKIWINGKPIYRKTFQFGPSAFTTQRQDIAHNIANIDMVVHNECFMYRNNENSITYRQFPSIYYGNLQGWAGQVFATPTLIKFELGTNLLAEMQLTNSITSITLEYTKTTD